ncbi:hypothetical protein Goarm_019190 [Gossypium armourianum]|uniref:Uncharacterized protein n=1 Tax=Gossypium armourianum TaxID=34283 RepID=A0A7J9IMG3_9ROSI|nr:hypothetical protein [Gossypium armourianum]
MGEADEKKRFVPQFHLRTILPSKSC